MVYRPGQGVTDRLRRHDTHMGASGDVKLEIPDRDVQLHRAITGCGAGTVVGVDLPGCRAITQLTESVPGGVGGGQHRRGVDAQCSQRRAEGLGQPDHGDEFPDTDTPG